MKNIIKLDVEKIQKELQEYKKPRRNISYDGRIAEVLQLFGYHFAKMSLEVPYFAPVIWIEPTPNCNFKCPMCLTGKGIIKKISSGFMDMTLFKKIVFQLKDKPIIRTALFFRGESLLHPKIVEMVELLSRFDLKPYFHTNGALMTPDLSEQLIKAGLTYISFSFDDGTKEGYEKIRVGGRYESILESIKGFLKIKKKLKSSLPYVVIQKIDFSGNGIDQRYKQLFKGLPVDQFKASPLHNWSGEIKELQVVEQATLPVYPCSDPWQRLTICWDGIVVGCCNDMLQKYVLGDIKKDRLDEIWNNEKMIKFRDLIRSENNKNINLCRGCSFLYVNDWIV